MTRIPGTDLDIRPLVLGANTFGWTADEHDSHAFTFENWCLNASQCRADSDQSPLPKQNFKQPFTDFWPRD